MLMVDKRRLKKGLKDVYKEEKRFARKVCKFALRDLAGCEVRKDGDKYFATSRKGTEVEIPPSDVREVRG